MEAAPMLSARSRLFAAIAVGVLSSTSAVPVSASTVGGGAAQGLTFRLIDANGSPAVAAEARVTILDALLGSGTKTVAVHRSSADALGRVTVAFPYNDPYVVAHPDKDRFNVEAHFVSTSIGGRRSHGQVRFVFDRRAGREATIDPVSGSTILLAQEVFDGPGHTSATDCANSPYDGAPAWMCSTTTYPASMGKNPTIFAINAGAGEKMRADITFEQAGRIQTTTAIDRGAGPVEVSGTVEVDSEDNTLVTYGGGDVRGGSAKQAAVILTGWAKIVLKYCERPGFPYNPDYVRCTHDSTSWLPDSVVSGTQIDLSHRFAVWHDDYCFPYSPSDCPDAHKFTCLTPIPYKYGRGMGTQSRRGWEATVELDGYTQKIPLHASTRYTRSESNTKAAAYEYAALDLANYDAFLFAYTDVPYDSSIPGGGVCPDVNIGNAWTYVRPVGDLNAVEVAEDAAAQVDRAAERSGTNANAENRTKQAGRCAHYPEDCRPSERR